MRGPRTVVEHLNRNQYHPRSNVLGNVVCMAILEDLLEHCQPLSDRARRGELVAKLNHRIDVGQDNWNIDLAIGPPPGPIPAPALQIDPIMLAVPATVEIAIEVKAVMTKHTGARRNRQRDLQAFHKHAHDYNPSTIAVGVLVINTAEYFWSPLRREDDLSRHTTINTVVPGTIDIYRSLPLRHTPSGGSGLEGKTVIAVEHDNLRLNPNRPEGWPRPRDTALVNRPPAPQVGEPIHYASMIQAVCTAYRTRWAV